MDRVLFSSKSDEWEMRKAEVRNEHKFEKGEKWILNEEKQTEGH